jgi:phytol kinase
MLLILTVIVVAVLLGGSELWWRKTKVHDEFSRKFIHITVGSFAAFWPFYLSWDEVRLLSVAFLVGVAVSKYFNIFKAIHSVQRPTLGELFFAVSAGTLSLITQDKWIFAAALLQMSLADGLAAVMGTAYGKKRYLVFGHTKSYVGTLTFFICSSVILYGYTALAHVHLSVVSAVTLAALATMLENVGVQGSDNLLVPIAVALVLRFAV